ncbi:amine oxidase [Meredithblackwellia eburnea MCA 4105]
MTTSEGYHWTPSTGVQAGNIETLGAVHPPTRKTRLASSYDCIVVGAGYAGLNAARDIALTGQSVLLLEARDRIGGRTWAAKVDGTLYEMGGTWVTDKMGYLYREMTRYGFENDLILTRFDGHKNDYFSLDVPGSYPSNHSHEKISDMQARAWTVFVSVDGNNCRDICPLPHSSLDNLQIDPRVVAQLDNTSCRQRYEEIKDQLCAEEQGLLLALLIHISGGTPENTSLWDMIKSHAIMGWDTANFGPVWLTYKLRRGQSALARAMFEEAVSAGLDYSFSTPITSIADLGSSVQVITPSAGVFTARRVVCTIPLNVLHSIKFSPPLSPKRQEAITLQHVNHMSKIHFEIEGDGMTSWAGCKYPARLLYAYGDGQVANGNAHVVAFGADQRHDFTPEKEPEKAVAALNDIHPAEVKRMVFVNWNTDPYSQGGPGWFRPGFATKYQAELQSPHGNILFASADWASGWRAAIDGALEQGSLAAYKVTKEIRELKKQKMESRL